MLPNANNDNLPELMRAMPAFAGLGIGRTKAYALMNAGTPPAVKLGRSTYIRREDWDRFIANLPSYQTISTSPLKVA